MPREIHIAGNAFAVEEFSASAGWHFILETRDAKFVGASTIIGSVDVHYPCHNAAYPDGETNVFRVTALLDPESIEPQDTRPSSDDIYAAFKREYGVSDDANWSFGYYEYTNGLEDGFDHRTYY